VTDDASTALSGGPALSLRASCACPWWCYLHPLTGPELTASLPGTELTAAAQVAELPPRGEEDSRVVSGLVLPFGPVGYTSVGPVRVPDASRVSIPEDVSRIRLMDYHQSPAVAIGYCTAIRPTPQGLRASFHVAQTPYGDAALLEIRERVRDGLSVELGAIDIRGDELLASQMLAVALVPIPAWEDARHDGLAAAREDSTTTTNTTTEGTPMTPEQRARLAELVAMNARTAEEEGEFLELVRLLATSPEETPADAPAPELAAAVQPAVAAGGPAALPAGMPGAPSRRAQRPVAELYAAMSRVLTGNSRPELEAALSDITTTANIWVSGTAYDGQLWEGLEYTRRYVPLMTPAPLNSYKGTGWRWVTKPEVADYAGDKAAVPSNVPETEATNWTAARLAGAHDIDRKFYDFNDTEFIAAYYAAMTESYAVKSDAKARAFILAMAAANAAVVGATTIWGAAIRAANAVMDATGGVQPDYFLVSQADMIGLADDSASSLPDTNLLEVFGVDPAKFLMTTGVAAGTVIGGIKQASRWRELGDTPIRVETINITNGGIDGGVFGYYATEAVHDGGVQRATFA